METTEIDLYRYDRFQYFISLQARGRKGNCGSFMPFSGVEDWRSRFPSRARTAHFLRNCTRGCPTIDPAMVLSIRVVKLTLADGTQEILLTTLRDAAAFPYAVFHGLYAKRWGSETHYDVLKNILEIENFTGKSALHCPPRFLCHGVDE